MSLTQCSLFSVRVSSGLASAPASAYPGGGAPTRVPARAFHDPNLAAYRLRANRAAKRQRSAKKALSERSRQQMSSSPTPASREDHPEQMLPEGVHTALHGLNQAGLGGAQSEPLPEALAASGDYDRHPLTGGDGGPGERLPAEDDADAASGTVLLSDSVDEITNQNLGVWSLLHGRGAQLTRSD